MGHAFTTWPVLPAQGIAPVWTGSDFVVGTEHVPVVAYHETTSGWTDNLTQMHEACAGSRHYIDRASRQRAMRSLAPVLRRPDPLILEVGCSSGFLLEELRRAAPHAHLVGSDFLSQPLRTLAGRLPGVPLAQFDITQCPLPDRSFDGVVLLNVLEHIADDRKALQEVWRVLKPGGIASIEVPAGPHLFDFYDACLMHQRRYTLPGLAALAAEVGFTVARASHLGFFLYPLFAMVKRRNRRVGRRMSAAERTERVAAQIVQGNGNPFLYALMRMELALGECLRYPIGIRCVMTARK